MMTTSRNKLSVLRILIQFSIRFYFTVVSEMQSYCSPDYHSSSQLAPAVASSALVHSSSAGNSPSNAMSTGSGCVAKFAPEIDPSYATGYNNWPSGYNNFQYASCQTAAAVQSQYPSNAPPTAPTMLIYPQVYSTVNQNQIHLHLHGTEKIEQYLQSSENSLTISSSRNLSIDTGVEDTSNVIMEADDAEHHHHHHQQQQQQHEQQTDMTQQPVGNRDDDQEVGDPSSVWRPY